MGRTLALDIGSRTIGIAVSDPLGLFAQPVRTLRRAGRKRDVEEIAGEVRRREVSVVVAGLPVRTDGTAGPEAEEVGRIVEALRAALPGVEVVVQDERFTTAQAERSLVEADVRRGRRKEVIDQVAAVLILQSWLDRRKG